MSVPASETALLLTLARSAGFLFRAPAFSHPDVPPMVRAGLAFALSFALRAPCTRCASFDAAALVCAAALEIFIGASIGTAASMLYDGAYCGGRALDDYVGIRASVPSANVAAGAGFGRLWSLAFAAAFFAFGGYRLALDAFAATFVSLPPGALVRSSDLLTFACALPATVARAAVLVAGPAFLIALVTQVALATVARVVPRFSTFALAFPVVFATAVFATVATLPIVLPSAAVPWMDGAQFRSR